MPKKRVKLMHLADRVATHTGKDLGSVLEISQQLFKEMGDALDRREVVTVLNMGQFEVVEGENGIPYVKFSPSHMLKNRINVSAAMNKYSVVLDQQKAMTAKLTGKCPECQQPLEQVDPPKCATHGTKPFEDRPSLEEGHGD